MNAQRRYIFGSVILLSMVLAFLFILSRIGSESASGTNAGSLNSRTSDLQKSREEGRKVLDQFSAAFEHVVSQVNPSVIPIFSEQVQTTRLPFGLPDDPFRDFFGEEFFRRFFGEGGGEQQRTIRSIGSGVIVSSDGYILTNNHVVAGASKLTVVLQNEDRYDAEIIGTDPPTDVAVIKIDAKDLLAATLGNSDDVRIGQWVIAVGNPFQLLHTVTAGIISAKGRSSVGLADYEDFIQTDASINPGNSGGALANLDGEVIGINTAIATPTGANAGIGFAVPINMARRVMEALIEEGRVARGYLGVTLQNIDENLARAFELKERKGALISEVTPNGPAARAGMRQGDVIVEYNGKEIATSIDARNAVAASEPESKAEITVIRDGKRREIAVILAERPSELTARTDRPRRGTEKPEEDVAPRLGLTAETLTAEAAQRLGYKGERGALISAVEPGSAADAAGLRRGDLIKEVNQQRISSIEQLTRIVRQLRSGETAAFLVRRGDNDFFVGLEVP